MRIRLKLTILLLVFSLGPLVAVEVVDAIGFSRLAGRVDQQVSDNISRRVEQELTVHVQRTAEQMGSMGRRVRMMTRTQAAIFEDALADRTQPEGPQSSPADARRYFRRGDLDALSAREIPPGFREQPGWPAGTTPPVVSYEKPLFLESPSAASETESLSLAGQLIHAAEELDALSNDLRESIRSQFIGVANGAHFTFPAKPGYEGFDPRARDWYAIGAESDDVKWVGPYIDAITGEPRMTAAAPVHAPDGTLLGVTGVDLALSKTIDMLELPAELALGSSAWVIALGEEDISAGRILLSTRTDDLVNTDANGDYDELFESMLDDLRAGRNGTRHVEVDGEPGIAAFGKIGPDVGLVMVVATHRIDSLVGGVRQDLRSIARESYRMAIGMSVFVVLLCFAGAYATGRTVSRPIRRLADAAQAVRDGDLSARASIRPRRDELGKLARTFNAMVPALEDRMRLRESVELANELQLGLLPSAPPKIPGFDVYGIAVYCDETGGDYFDYLKPLSLGENRHGLALGDVTGHGIPAALVMTSAQALLLSHARHTTEPHKILERINDTITEKSSHGRFMTFALIVLDTKLRTLEVANAGHDPALILRSNDGSFEELPLGGLPLGIMADESYETMSVAYPQPGDVLLIGTDGIWETRDPQGKLYGKERMREIVRTNAHKSAREIGDEILEDLKVYRGAAPVLDDITFIIAKAEIS